MEPAVTAAAVGPAVTAATASAEWGAAQITTVLGALGAMIVSVTALVRMRLSLAKFKAYEKRQRTALEEHLEHELQKRDGEFTGLQEKLRICEAGHSAKDVKIGMLMATNESQQRKIDEATQLISRLQGNIDALMAARWGFRYESLPKFGEQQPT